MKSGTAGDRLSGASKRLFTLLLAMVIAGFAIPSPGISVPPPSDARTESGVTLAPGYTAFGKPANPTRLIVPSIKLRAPIVPIEVDPDGVLHPPGDVHKVGWWQRSAKPGAADGQTLIAGHTVHTGGGVMNELGDLRPGAVVRIKTASATMDYRTTKVFVYTRDELADNAAKLFGQDREQNRLVLVTCTAWNGHSYDSNIIVFAEPLGVRVKKQQPVEATGSATREAA